MNIHATIQELLNVAFPARKVPDYLFPEHVFVNKVPRLAVLIYG
jgi:hypothetical protein